MLKQGNNTVQISKICPKLKTNDNNPRKVSRDGHTCAAGK